MVKYLNTQYLYLIQLLLCIVWLYFVPYSLEQLTKRKILMSSQFCLRVRKAKEGTETRLVLKTKEEVPLPMTTTQGAYVLFCNAGFYCMSHLEQMDFKSKTFLSRSKGRVVEIDTTGIHAGQDKSINVTFHVLVPLEAWNWNTNSHIHIQFGHWKLGNWKGDIGEFCSPR